MRRKRSAQQHSQLFLHRRRERRTRSRGALLLERTIPPVQSSVVVNWHQAMTTRENNKKGIRTLANKENRRRGGMKIERQMGLIHTVAELEQLQ
jgi:hypothetical protein